MKKLLINVLLLGIMVAFFGSCKDDEKPTGGSFTYDGEKLSLKNGFSKYWGTETDGDDTYYFWEVTFTSAGITFDDEVNNMVGSGEMLYLYLAGLNTGESELPIGTFNLNAAGESFLDWGGIVLGYDSEEQSGNWFYSLNEGSFITITKSGSKYTIAFTFIFDNGTATGTFFGTLAEGYIPK